MIKKSISGIFWVSKLKAEKIEKHSLLQQQLIPLFFSENYEHKIAQSAV